MNLEDAISSCHVRSAVRRTSNPSVKYWKNHNIPLTERIPQEEQSATDWEEYDPRDDDNCSLFMFND